MKKYLLLGGTGPIGIYLVNELTKDSRNVIYVTSRKERASLGNVHYLQGDAHDIEFLKLAISTIGETINAIVDFMVWETYSFEGVYKLLLSNCMHYIYISSSRIYANIDGKITESSPRLLDVTLDKTFIKTDNYALPKARQENMLFDSEYNNYTIIRPYITYAENRLPLGSLEKEIWLYRALHERTIIMPKDIGEHYTSLTYGKDCADVISRILVNNYLVGEVVNITTDEEIKWSEVLDIYVNVLKKRFNMQVKVKYIEKSLKPPFGDYQTIYDRLFNRVFDNSRLAKYVDTSKFMKVEEGLSISLNKFLDEKRYNLRVQNWNLQAEFDKISGEKALRCEFDNNKQYIKYLLHRYLPITKIKKYVYNLRKC